jgi:tRNA(Ile)-lysidine synthase
MEHLVKDQCAQMNNDLVIENIFLKGVNSNIESNFRKMRYSKLEEIRKEIKADFILTAHHADDQVETILMKIMNSSGLDGLQGLRKLKQNIIRPMYNISKSEISDYASLNNVKYIDDPTNSDNTFTRNFLRMNVIPELKKIKNDIHIPFNNFTDRIDEVHDLIAFNVQNFCNSDSYRVNDNNIEINKSDFYNLPFLVQFKIISNQCIDTENSFSKTDVREIKDLLRKNLTGSSKTVIDKTILIDRNSLIIYKNMKNDIFINVEAGKEFKGKDFTFSWDFNKAPKTFNNNNEIEFIDASKITDNLVIRSVRDNDSFLPLGMSGNKKVAKFLKDKNLSFLKRKESLVVCNQDEIIWVAGHQLSEKYKIHKNSVKIVKLNFSRN